MAVGDGPICRAVDIGRDPGCPTAAEFGGELGEHTVDALTVVRDSGLEWAPVIAVLIGTLSLFALTFWLIRRGLAKSRNAMRL